MIMLMVGVKCCSVSAWGSGGASRSRLTGRARIKQDDPFPGSSASPGLTDPDDGEAGMGLLQVNWLTTLCVAVKTRGSTRMRSGSRHNGHDCARLK